MTSVTAAELAQMRADLEAMTLPGTAVVQALTRTTDGQGGYTEAWAASGTVACRLDNSGGNRRSVRAAEITFSGWVLTVPQSTGLTTANRVVTGGETYNVISVSDLGSWIACQRAEVQRI